MVVLLHGRPHKFRPCSRERERAVDVAAQRKGDVFAIVTPSSVELWQVKPRLNIATHVRSPEDVQNDGECVSVMWTSSGRNLLVSTQRGGVILYEAVGSKLKQTMTPVASQSYTPLGPATAVARVLLTCLGRIWEDSVLCCGIVETAALVFSCDSGALTIRSWHDERILRNVDLPARFTAERRSCSVVHTHFSAKLHRGCLGTVYSDGAAFIVYNISTSSAARESPNSTQVQTMVLPTSAPAVLIALSAQYCTVAVADELGNVLLFRIAARTPAAAAVYTCSLATLGLGVSGVPTSLRTSWNGDAFCLGMRDCGVALWSVSGFLLGSTRSADNTRATEGVSAVTWGPFDYSIMAIPQDSEALIELPAARLCPSDAGECAILLDGSSVFRLTSISASIWSWYRVRISPEYLRLCGPARCGATSAGGKYLAVCARRGVLTRERNSRWKLIEFEADSVACSALGWLRVAGCGWVLCAAGKFNRVHGLSFSGGTSAAELLNVELPARIVAMSVHSRSDGANVLCGCSNGDTVLFAVVLIQGALKVNIMWETTAQHVPLHLALVPSSEPHTCEGYYANAEGRLLFCDMKSGKSNETSKSATIRATETEMVDFVEVFWVDESMSSDGMPSVWFASHGTLSVVWRAVPGRAGETHRLSVDCEAHPLGLITGRGACLFARAHGGAIVGEGAWTSAFEGRVQELPVLHKAIYNVVVDLGRNAPPSRGTARSSGVDLTDLSPVRLTSSTPHFADDLKSVAIRYAHVPHFMHCLEAVLRECLEHDTERRPGSVALLPLCIDLVEDLCRATSGYPAFLELVVSCLRKSDLALWSPLLDALGGVHVLFEACLDCAVHHTAVQCLVVVQNTTAVEEHEQYAVRLLRKLLRDDSFVEFGALAGFLSTAYETSNNTRAFREVVDCHIQQLLLEGDAVRLIPVLCRGWPLQPGIAACVANMRAHGTKRRMVPHGVAGSVVVFVTAPPESALRGLLQSAKTASCDAGWEDWAAVFGAVCARLEMEPP